MKARICVCSMFAFLLSCSIAFGQTITGSITGTVTDPSGAAVNSAKVTAINVDTGVQTPTATNANGIYTIQFLQIGHYKVSVAAQGFAPTNAGPFALEVSQEAKIDVHLTVGSVNESVVVSIAAPILNTQNAITGDTITAAAATELPLQGRNFSSLTLLVAGAIAPNPMAQNSVARSSYNGGFFINGNREQTNNYTLDGADINEAIDNYIGYSPNVDALGEVKVISGNATAEYGNANGGQVVMVTKSGTNQLHGNAFWFLENTNLNANSWSNKHYGITQVPNLNRSIFGGTLGGPIVKDKLFFFVDYQGAREHTGGSGAETVAPLSYRQGHVPGILPGLFPGDVVPVTNPAAIYLFAHPELYPLPNNSVPGIRGNYVGHTGTFVRNNQGDIKIDWVATRKDAISGRYSMSREFNGTTKTILPTDIPSNNADPYTGFVVNWTHTFSSSIVSDARAGYGRSRYIGVPTDITGGFGITGNSKLGVPGTQSVTGISQFLIGATDGLTDLGPGGGGTDSDSIVNAFTYGENLSIQLGRHALKVGGQALRYQENRYYSGNDGVLGHFNYDGSFTAGKAGTTTYEGNSFADFLQDNVRSLGQGALTGRWGQRQWRDALFVQDDYKLRPNLTINLGMRWEYDQPLYEVNNKEANINLQTGAIINAGVNGASRALYSAFYGGFMPRVGFAYSPGINNGRLVLRGGYSITNDLEGTGANLRLTLNPPFFVDSSFTSNNGVPFRSATGFPRPTDPSQYAGNVRAWDPHLKPALVQQYNLTTEYQVDNATSFTLAYLGQTGNHLVDPKEGNQAVLPAALTGGTPILPLAKFTNLSHVTNVSYTESAATMNYNSLQTTLRRRAAHGLEFLANYTWSKSMSNNLGYYGAGGVDSQSAYWQNAYDPSGDYGPAFFDAANNFSFSGYYDLPFGRGKQFGGGMNRFADLAVGGWKLGAIASLHTGFPITVSSTDAVNANARTARANHYNKLRVVNRSIDHWFGTDASAGACATNNGTCAYGPELPTQFGTARVGSERAPGYHDLDAALSKAFFITEDKHLDFRTDFFNVLNTSSLAPPNSNISSTTFGQVTDTNSTQRQIQLALKFVF